MICFNFTTGHVIDVGWNKYGKSENMLIPSTCSVAIKKIKAHKLIEPIQSPL